ncbi:MAG: hypothetical protein V4702_01850 [Patescibacteria group bacterium]
MATQTSKIKIGVFGSVAGDMNTALPRAKELGNILAKYSDSIIIITGACTGLPYIVAKEAHDAGVEVWGFSATLDKDSQNALHPNDDNTIYDQIFYVESDFKFASSQRVNFKYRNVLSTATCDAGIFISGRWGTLNEFTDLIDFQKIAGVLTGTGGIADELPELTRIVNKEGQGKIIFNDDPEVLVQQILTELGFPKTV